MKNEKRASKGINAGSMADVAFLLLIFFLVVTTIDVDKGITVKLPPWCEECIDDYIPIAKHNLFSVKVNARNEIMVRGEPIVLDAIRDKAKAFISNNGVDPNLSSSPRKAVIALQNDRNTTYDTYISVYNELKAAYNELWEAESQNTYGLAYANLDNASKKEIRTKIPLIISESEPSTF
ncbi:MAG: biopolymer transporter ExbD [Bacteroidota bacterium]